MLLPIFIVGWVLGAFSLYAMLIVIVRIIFEQGKALWIKDGKIIFLHRWNFSVAFARNKRAADR